MQTDEFGILEQYERPEAWEGLSRKERARIGTLFVWRAESEARSGGGIAARSLEFAECVGGELPQVLYALGEYWLHVVEPSEVSFKKSLGYYKAAVQKRPGYAQAIWGWATASTQLGILADEGVYLEEAEALFRQVDPNKLRSKKRRGGFFWDWGFKWLRAAEASGEPMDYQVAVQKFKLAAHEGLKLPAFFIDWGTACLQLADLVGGSLYLERAGEHFFSAVRQDDQNPVSWFGLARTLQSAFSLSGEREIFDRATQAYEAAALASDQSATIISHWMHHLLEGGATLHDVSLLHHGVELFDQLYPDEGMDREVEDLCACLKALILLGEAQERLDFLRRAEKLAREGLHERSQDPTLRCLLGDALAAQGSYFGEAHWHRQAMEQFARALAADAAYVEAHMGMARAGFALGNETEEAAFLEKASRHLLRVRELDSANIDAWNLSAVTHLRWAQITEQSDRAAQAVRDYEQAIELQGGIAAIEDLDAVSGYGYALDVAGTFGDEELAHRRAVEVLGRVAQLAPEDPVVHFRLGMAFLHCGELSLELDDYRQAVRHLERACCLEPEEGGIWDEWGCALLALAHLMQDPTMPQNAQELRIQAEGKLRRAAALGHYEALYHLACCASQVGEHGVALEYLHKAKQRGGLPPVEHLLNDEWIAPLREQPGFSAFVNSL